MPQPCCSLHSCAASVICIHGLQAKLDYAHGGTALTLCDACAAALASADEETAPEMQSSCTVMKAQAYRQSPSPAAAIAGGKTELDSSESSDDLACLETGGAMGVLSRTGLGTRRHWRRGLLVCTFIDFKAQVGAACTATCWQLWRGSAAQSQHVDVNLMMPLRTAQLHICTSDNACVQRGCQTAHALQARTLPACVQFDAAQHYNTLQRHDSYEAADKSRMYRHTKSGPPSLRSVAPCGNP